MNEGLKNAAQIAQGLMSICHVCSFHLGNKFKDTFFKGLEKGCSLPGCSRSLSGVPIGFKAGPVEATCQRRTKKRFECVYSQAFSG
jgi:hypothetical protein